MRLWAAIPLLLCGSSSAYILGTPPVSSLCLGARRPALALSTRSGARRAATTSSALSLHAKLGALLFACDGVLADTETDGHRIALNMALKQAGLSMECSVEQYGELLQMRDVQRIEQYWKSIGWKDMTTELALKVYQSKSKIFRELVKDGKVPLRKGVVSLIDEAMAASIPVAVCSSNTKETVNEIVKLLGSKRAEYVTVFSGEDVKRRKPAPDVYQLAQIKFGVNPEDCVVFEDNGVGLQSAKAARMLCVISKSKYTAADDFPEADAVVDDLESGEINLERVAGMAFNMQGLNA